MSTSVMVSANFLFALRIFPLTVSALVTLFFTFPSFWLLERASLGEDVATFILALCSLVIFSAGLFRVFADTGENDARGYSMVDGIIEPWRRCEYASTERFEWRSRADSGGYSESASNGLRRGGEGA